MQIRLVQHRALRSLLAALLLGCAGTAAAQAQRVDAILAQVKAHGYAVPGEVVARLQQASDRPGPDAPMEAARRYHGALAELASAGDEVADYEKSVSALEDLASRDACRMCTAQVEILRAQRALTRDGAVVAMAGLAKAGTLLGPAPPVDLKLYFLAVRARAHRLSGDFAQSVKDAVDASRLAVSSGDAARQVELLIMLALDNAQLGDMGRADQQISEAIAQARRIGFGYQLAYAYLNLGHIRSLENRREEQREALTTALELAKGKPQLAEVEMISLSNLADYNLSLGDNAKALEYADRAEALSRRLGERRSLGIALTNVGIASARLGHVDAGVAKVREAIGIAKAMNNGEHVTGMLHELATIYENAGRYREAVATLHEVAGFEKQLTEQERKRDVLAVQEQYASERSQREIARLSSENARQQALSQVRNVQRTLWAVLALAFGLATALLIQVHRSTARVNRKLSAVNEALAEETTRDPLTGAFNRRYFEDLMQRHQDAANNPSRQRQHQPYISFVALDLDHFKQINDTRGHAAGDAVLVEVTARLHMLLRQQDAVVRWGGEEFVLVLPGTGAAGARVLVERVLQAIGDQPVTHGVTPIHVTASAGSASIPVDDVRSWNDALQVADLALYRAKGEGRNRGVCVAGAYPEVDMAFVAGNLSAAEAAGLVELAPVSGPEQPA